MMRGPLPTLISLLMLGLTVLPVTAQSTPEAGPLPYAPANAGRLIALSPDGTMVAGLQADTGALCTYAVPSGDEIACVDLKAQNIRIREEDLRWSPNSHAIVFAEMAFVYLIDGDIWRFDAQTGDLTDLTDEGDVGEFSPINPEKQTGDVYLDVSPAWSPDGSTIAFSRTTFPANGEDSPNDLMLLDVASGAVTKLVNFDPTYPGALYFGMGWSPDGGTIYASAGYSDLDNPRNGVWAFDAVSGAGAHLAGASDAAKGAFPALLAVSPAGDSLTVDYPAFLGQYGYSDQKDTSGFGLLDLTRATVTPIMPPADLTEYGLITAGPNYTPDGTTIVYGLFKLDSGEPGQIVAQTLATGDVSVLATLPDGERPITINYGVPLQIGANGTIFVQTGLNSGYLASLPVDLLTPPQPGRPPITFDATPAASPVAAGNALTVTAVDTVMRSSPSVDAQVVLVLQPGAIVEPLGEPVETDGETWTPVRDPESNTIGYIRASDLESVPES